MRNVSIGSMLTQISGLTGTGDLSDWEEDFVTGLVDRHGTDSTALSDKQVIVVERIWKKHFA